jgi:hypothetical protein
MPSSRTWAELLKSGIVVSRTSEKDIGMRGLFVLVDELEEVTLQHGDELDLDLEPGPHKLMVTNRLVSKRVDFILKEGERARFLASNTQIKGLLGLIFAGIVVIGGTGPYTVTLERTS